jgi:hypothetical protein
LLSEETNPYHVLIDDALIAQSGVKGHGKVALVVFALYDAFGEVFKCFALR